MTAGSENTAIGIISITEEEGRIVSVSMDTDERHSDDTVLSAAFAQLNEYLSGRRKEFDLEYGPEGTDFQKDVWRALMRIPYGRTVSYSELAEMSGHPGAQRAVGNAVGRNPVPIFIPCHRVIRSDGDIGGFSLGVELKKRLLELEGSV